MSMTSGQFNSELFEMANGSSFAEDSTYTTYITETVTFDNSGKATVAYVPVADSITWAGQGTSDTATISGKEVTVTGLTGDVELTYETVISGAHVAKINNSQTAIGAATLRWPVYSSGDDCSDSAIKGYVEMKIFRCRVSQGPGFDTSYKSAATNQVTFATMDAKRLDNTDYSIAYFELTETP